MDKILYRNDKKRIILYELLREKRELKWGESKEYNRLKEKRNDADAEKRVLLKELLAGGYIATDGMQISEHFYTNDILHQKKRITPMGETLLKKELPSELKEERRQKIRRIATDIYAIVATLVAIFEFVWFKILGK